jgi:L-malate glycosyltransferase
MSLGKPAVVTSAGGIPEIVKDRQTGILVRAGDADALAAGILEMLRRPDLAEAFGRNARERYEQMYRPEVMARAMESYFCGLLTRN